jgi:hypothetical protein
VPTTSVEAGVVEGCGTPPATGSGRVIASTMLARHTPCHVTGQTSGSFEVLASGEHHSMASPRHIDDIHLAHPGHDSTVHLAGPTPVLAAELHHYEWANLQHAPVR